jgi:hypothetical protein
MVTKEAKQWASFISDIEEVIQRYTYNSTSHDIIIEDDSKNPHATKVIISLDFTETTGKALDYQE